MLKKICIGILAILTIFAFAACSGDYAAGGEAFRVGDLTYVFLNAGEEIELDFKELYYEELSYGGQPPTVKKTTIVSGENKVFNVHKNKIRANGTGVSYAEVNIQQENAANYVFSFVVHVINPSDKDMKEIKTAQDLSDMATNNANGTYVLKNDIDLEGFGDWAPIARYSEQGVAINGFSGIFVNPYGYKIKNLTVSTAAHEGGYYGNGLFTSLYGAYIDGLILENVSINTTIGDDIPSGDCYAGGISGIAISSTIRNCSVNGNIVSQTAAGGIVGKFSHGLIVGSDFSGTLEQTSSKNTTNLCGAGGIVGAGYQIPQIFNCTAEATIAGASYAGGIAGLFYNYNDLPELYIKNCLFDGELTAPYIDDICVHFYILNQNQGV